MKNLYLGISVKMNTFHSVPIRFYKWDYINPQNRVLYYVLADFVMTSNQKAGGSFGYRRGRLGYEL